MDNRGITGEKSTDQNNAMILKVDSCIEDTTSHEERNTISTYSTEIIASAISAYLEANQVNYQDRGVVIWHDGTERAFAHAGICASIFGAAGIKVNMFRAHQPAVLLSFAIRYFGAAGGLQITSDETEVEPEHSLYLYNESGSRMTETETAELLRYIKRSPDHMPARPSLETLEQENLLLWICDEIENAYLYRLDRLSDKVLIQDKPKNILIAIAADHPATEELMTKALQQQQFLKVTSHKEYRETADILLKTHDSELFVYVQKADKSWKCLSNQALVHLLTNYILIHSDKNLLHNARILYTAGTENKYNLHLNFPDDVEVIETAPGFLHIAERIKKFDETGETFLFGYDGNGGYLIDNFVRDKDAIQTAVVVAEMVWYYRAKNLTLLDAEAAIAAYSD